MKRKKTIIAILLLIISLFNTFTISATDNLNDINIKLDDIQGALQIDVGNIDNIDDIDDNKSMESLDTIPKENINKKASDVTEFLSIESVVGEKEITGVNKGAKAVIGDTSIATYSNGIIYAHKEGNTTVKIPMTNGATKTVKTSVYYKYVQPKTAEIIKNTTLHKWGKLNNSDTLGTLTKGEKITILYRAGKTESGSSMQYVTTSSGKTGYMWSQDSSDRGNDIANREVKVGGTIYALTRTIEVDEDNIWSINDTSIASVASVTHDGYKKQGKVTGKKSGITTLIAKSPDGNTKCASFVNVYSSFNATYKANTKRALNVKTSAISSSNTSYKSDENKILNIIGECGNYYRCNANRYVYKSYVDVLCSEITLNYTNALLYDKNANTLKLNVTKTPSFATEQLTYKSSNENVATVDNNGNITAEKQGSAIISVKGKYVSKECKITVVSPIKNVKLNKTETIVLNGEKELNPVYAPSELSQHKYEWNIEDDSVLTINNKTVKGIKEGVSYVFHSVTPPTPTIGSQSETINAKSLVSVYSNEDENLKLITKDDDTKIYPAAVIPTEDKYSELIEDVKTIKDKNTLIIIIGASGDFYYVKDRQGNILGFVSKEDVEVSQSTVVISESEILLYNKKGYNRYQINLLDISVDEKKGITYESSNDKVAKVDENGMITALKVGKANIIAKSPNGSMDECEVNVIEPVKSVSIGKNRAVKQKGTVKFEPTYKPQPLAKGHTYKWKVSNGNLGSMKGRKFEAKNKTGSTIITYTVTAPVPTGHQKGISKSDNVVVSVYKPVKKINGYLNCNSNFFSAASDSKYNKKYNKLEMGSKVTILGECGKYYYINCGNDKRGDKGKGFVLRKNVAYIKLSKKSSVVRKGGTNEIIVKVYNDDYRNITWSKTKKVTFKKISHKKGKRNGYGCYVTRVRYRVYGKKETARRVTATKNNKVSDYCFYSVYTHVDTIQGFKIKGTNKLKKAASESKVYRIKNFDIEENTRTDIIGKCNGWYYVKTKGRKGFLGKKRVAYIGFDSTYNTMYRYNYKILRTELVHKNSGSKNIKWKITKNESAVKVSTYNENGKRYLKVFADKPKTVTIRAKYNYHGKSYIQRYRKLKIKNIKIILKKNKSISVGQKVKIKAKVQTLPGVKIQYRTASTKANLKKASWKRSKKGINVTGKKLGKVYVQAKYKGLKMKICTVNVNALLIYQAEQLPGKDKDNDKEDAPDMLGPTLSKKTILSKKDILGRKTFKESDFHSESALYKNLMNLCDTFAKTSFKYRINNKTYKIDLKPVAQSMYKHFYDGSGIPFRDKKLSKVAKCHWNSRNYISKVKQQINIVLNYTAYKGNIYNMKYTHTKGDDRLNYDLIYLMKKKNINEPSFGQEIDYVNGLALVVHGLWGNKIEVIKYNYNPKTRYYKGKLKFTYYDHFGLDSIDIKKYGMFKDFRAWYILQRYNKYKNKNGGANHKPFITYMEFTEDFSGYIK